MADCLSPAELDDYLNGVLSEDERRIVESHLEECVKCHDVIVEREIEQLLPPEGPAAAVESPKARESDRSIGPYRLLHELGRGGQARVYLVEDSRLPRRVALKVFPSGLAASPSVLHRFQREAAALSRLDHPGISTVYETGEWEGCPYIAMRYVEGETLAQWITASVEARQRGAAPILGETMQTIHLIERAARALHVAHQAGLVHRDVKPSNIMITRDGEPVIVDFGLVQDEESLDASLTRSGDLAGTLAYMSPEQIRAERHLVDRQSDVYSLGVTLYEALTLTLPFDAPTTAGVFQRILSGQLTDPSSLRRHVSRDLKVIIETALERDRCRRYLTALALAEDLRRYREHETILAHPAGPGLRLKRWTQRNPVIAVSLLGVFLILITALGGSLALLDRVRRESAVRAAALGREEGLRLALQSAAVLRENPGQALLLAIEAARRDPSLSANNALIGALERCHERVRLFGHEGSLNQASFSPDGSRVVTASHDRTARIWDVRSAEAIAVLRGHQGVVVTAEFSPDGKRVLTAAEDATAGIWDASSGAEVVRLSGHVHGLVLARFSPDGSRVVTAGGDTARIWDAATGAGLRRLEGHTAPILCARFSPDGTRIVSGAEDSTAIIWEVASGRALFHLGGHEGVVVDARWSAGGAQVITASGGSAPPTEGGVARIWEADSGKLVASLKGHKYGIYAAALVRDGEFAVTGSEDFTARIWEAKTGRELFVLGHEHKVIHLDLSPDGRRLLTASYDRAARLWETSTGRLLATLKGHAAPLQHAAFSPDGESLVTSSVDSTARVWSLRPPWPVDALAGRSGVAALAAMDPGGESVAAVDSAGITAEVVAYPTGARKAILSGHQGPITWIEFSPDGRTVLTASKDATARLWSTETGVLLHELAGHTAAVLQARFSGNGRRIATASEDHTVRIWDPALGVELAIVKGPESPFLLCSLSPDGQRVICGAKNGLLSLADAGSGQLLESLNESRTLPRSAEWSPDGGRIVLATNTSRVQVRDAATGETLGVLLHASRTHFAAYSPDGKWIATLCEDRIVRIWEAQTLQEWLNLTQEGVSTSSNLSFVSSGERVAILGWDTGQWTAQKSRLLVYPLDPATEAVRCYRGALIPDERDRFLVGSAEERAAYRAAWSGGGAFGPGPD
jgi:WD40 repeat protein